MKMNRKWSYMTWIHDWGLCNRPATVLLFRIGDLHGIAWSDLKSLQSVLCSTWLNFILKLNKSDVMTTWHKTNFLKSRESIKKIAIYQLLYKMGAISCDSLYNACNITYSCHDKTCHWQIINGLSDQSTFRSIITKMYT